MILLWKKKENRILRSKVRTRPSNHMVLKNNKAYHQQNEDNLNGRQLMEEDICKWYIDDKRLVYKDLI